jgi:hypothetical protein
MDAFACLTAGGIKFDGAADREAMALFRGGRGGGAGAWMWVRGADGGERKNACEKRPPLTRIPTTHTENPSGPRTPAVPHVETAVTKDPVEVRE